MATVTLYTAERMAEIEAMSVVDGEIVGDNLILTRFDESTIDAGNVRGPQGIQGITGPPGEGSAFTSFTPGQFVQSGVVSFTPLLAVRREVGAWRHELVHISFTSSGTAANPIIHTVPSCSFTYGTNIFLLSGTRYKGHILAASSTTIVFADTSGTSSQNQGQSPSFNLQNTSFLIFERWYLP